MKLTIFTLTCLYFAVVSVSCTNGIHKHEASHKRDHNGKNGSDASKTDEAGKKHYEHKKFTIADKSSKHDQEKGRKIQNLKEDHKKSFREGKGEKTTHHDGDGHHSSQHSGGDSAHGAKFQEGSKYLKKHYKKGFRDLYHKDEHKKQDSFYSNHHKSGDYVVYGSKHSKYGSNSSKNKKVQHHTATASAKDHGKKGSKVTGHKVEDKKGHRDQKSMKTKHDIQKKWGKKTTKTNGKQYKYVLHPQ